MEGGFIRWEREWLIVLLPNDQVARQATFPLRSRAREPFMEKW
jgi:hypothetical protein